MQLCPPATLPCATPPFILPYYKRHPKHAAPARRRLNPDAPAVALHQGPGDGKPQARTAAQAVLPDPDRRLRTLSTR